MNRYRFAACLAMTTLAILASARPVAAQDRVPFRGSMQGLVTRSGAPPIVSVNVAAQGMASHLGRFSLVIPHSVDTTTRTATGSYLFVAANGDTLTADFTGQSVPTAADPSVLYIVETATITGGTGRFAAATGRFTCERLYDTTAGTTVGSFEGTVSSAGAGTSSIWTRVGV